MQIIQLLLFDEKNVIFIAKTKFDKNIIFQTIFLMLKFIKMTLIIMFIKTLKNQQCKKLKNI